jgi:hypothetical protein
MLLEVSLLQRFVLLLGHPVYSLTVTLFSLLLGTGLGASGSRRFEMGTLRRIAIAALAIAAIAAVVSVVALGPILSWAIPLRRVVRIAIAVAMLVPVGVVLGVPLPAGIRLLSSRAPAMVAWAWGINGALSVTGATVAMFVALNWGFSATFLAAAGAYLIGLIAFVATY